MTFDENWLMQISLASRRGDDASMTFLLRSRVAAEHQRLMRYLVAKTSEYFSLI